MQELLLP